MPTTLVDYFGQQYNPTLSQSSTAAMLALGFVQQITPYGSARSSGEPSTRFSDPFDGSTIDTVNRWLTGGTSVPTQASGQVSLNLGTSNSISSTLISQPAFPSTIGFTVFGATIALDNAKQANPNCHRFWGFGQVTSFASATPVTDGVGFECDLTGEVSCVIYVGGTKYVANSTSNALISSSAGTGGSGTAVPAGSAISTLGQAITWPSRNHRYVVIARGDLVFWYIDSIDVPVAYASFIQPNVQALPARFAAITTPAVSTVLATTFTVGAMVIGDSAAQNTALTDSNYPWRGMSVGQDGGAGIKHIGALNATYSASANVAAAASATDIATLTGSATKTVYITGVTISGIQTTAGLQDILLIKRSTADTGGTSAAMTAVPHDSTDAVATATALSYTANPAALGTAVGTFRRGYLPIAGATSVVNPVVQFDFGKRGKPLVLRGTGEVAAINLNGATVTGGTFDVVFEWYEGT